MADDTGLGSWLGSAAETLGQPVTEAPVNQQLPQSLDNAVAITDIPGGAPGRPRNGPIEGVIHHHTGGSTLEGAYATSKEKGTGTNYYITRKTDDQPATVVRRVPDDQYTAHIREPHSRYRNGKWNNLGNGNTVGVEVVAKNDKDVQPEQRVLLQQLTDKLVQDNGVNGQNVAGHGEIQGGPHGNREPDEGTFSAQAYRNGVDVASLQPGQQLPDSQQPLTTTDQLKTQAKAEEEKVAALTKDVMSTNAANEVDRSQATNPETNQPEYQQVDHDPFADTLKKAFKAASDAEANVKKSAVDTAGEALTAQQSSQPAQLPQQPEPLNPGIFGQLAQSAGLAPLTPQFIPVDHDPFAKA